MIADVAVYLGVTVGALLPVVNPLSTAPVFLAVTRGFSVSHRNDQGRLASIYMAVILLVSLFAGALVLTFFGITIPILRIAGGLVIARVGFGMLDPGKGESPATVESSDAQSTGNVAFTPVAMPMLAGPGSIATTIAMATETSGVFDLVGISLGIVVVSFVAWVTLRSAAWLLELIGSTGMDVVTRLMGLILICIGIRFVTVGLVEGLTGDAMTEALRLWLERLHADGA